MKSSKVALVELPARLRIEVHPFQLLDRGDAEQ